MDVDVCGVLCDINWMVFHGLLDFVSSSRFNTLHSLAEGHFAPELEGPCILKM